MSAGRFLWLIFLSSVALAAEPTAAWRPTTWPRVTRADQDQRASTFRQANPGKWDPLWVDDTGFVTASRTNDSSLIDQGAADPGRLTEGERKRWTDFFRRNAVYYGIDDVSTLNLVCSLGNSFPCKIEQMVNGVAIAEIRVAKYTTMSGVVYFDTSGHLWPKAALPQTQLDDAAMLAKMDKARYRLTFQPAFHACDPLPGQPNSCPPQPSARVEEVTATAADLKIARCTALLWRDRQSPVELRPVIAVRLRKTLGLAPQQMGVLPLGTAPRLPLQVDAVTGEDLSALLATGGNGTVRCPLGAL